MSTSAGPSHPPGLAPGLPDRYRVLRHLASGGMASVWCAEDRLLGRDVAIKILSERFAHDELSVRRFKREARAAARVSAHPNVVTIFDVGELAPGSSAGATPGAFIVMEYLAGGTVAAALRDKAVARTEARRWLREAAAALDHAHTRGIVHRDIKPANFLLDRDRGLHVADFGIARLQSEETITSSGELFGTAAYLSPEQAVGHEATAASDLYALAVAAFELLTGGRPYTAGHFAAQARQHIEDEPPRASERDSSLPSAVDAVLTRGMAKAPEDRYPSGLAFVDALEAALDEVPTERTRPLPAPAIASPPIASPRVASPRVASPPIASPPIASPAIAGPAQAAARPRGNRRPPAPPLPPVLPSRRRGSGRRLPLVALLAVAVGVAYLLSQLGGGAGPRVAQSHRLRVARAPSAARHARPASSSAESASSTTSQAGASSTPASLPTSPPSPTSASASDLQLTGHEQLAAGNYPQAIATLHRALAAASPGSLTYAYALYDLGDALLRSGDPQAAIPVLEQRLRIPNQTTTVQLLLDQARQAAGQGSTGGTPVGNGKPEGNGNGNGHGNGNGNGSGNGNGN